MAADVDGALREVVAREGGMTPEAAKEYVGKLTAGGLYKRDVY